MIVKSNIIGSGHCIACLLPAVAHICMLRHTCMHFDAIRENQVDTLTLVLKILEYLKRLSKRNPADLGMAR